MITKISINNVASYKSPTALVTDKPVNLIYGLNGAGKTTISKFLNDLEGDKYSECEIEPKTAKNYIFRVYNQSFVDEVFFNQDVQKGIFTLSKENKSAEIKIAQAKNKQLSIQEKQTNIQNTLNQTNKDIERLKTKTQNTCFKIKQKFCGGDRILDQAGFLTGLKYKAPLLEHILGLDREDIDKEISDIESEVELLKKTSSEGITELPLIHSTDGYQQIETDNLFKQVIVGKTDSTISELIDYLGSADWFTDGLDYLNQSKERCPFCQQPIDFELKHKLLDYIDDSYKTNINELNRLKRNYDELVVHLPTWDFFQDSAFIENLDKFKNLYNGLKQVLKQNQKLIDEKINKPSQIIELTDTKTAIKELNSEIERANLKINAHNLKVKNKRKSLLQLKADFWQIQRNKYHDTICSYKDELSFLNKKKETLEKQIQDKSQAFKKQSQIIQEQQRQTTNIDVTIDLINTMLTDCGIVGFKIIKHEEHFYRIAREDDDSQEQVFTSLSEGEKTMISFFYFLALCKGNTDLGETQDKIIVIDDPISSLSHMYVFNIAQLIKRELTDTKVVKGVNGANDSIQIANKNCIQCFIFTHSLYFFYDLTLIDDEKRKKAQNLFRVVKGINGSEIVEMKYEEIQNDYQSYWSIVSDPNSPPALLANSMRNIIEYFFNFIEKKDLNNTFKNDKLSDIKFQSFNRYINRESHSLGQNIFDYKEFDYDVFREAFKLVFEVNDYSTHYNKMMRIK